MEFATKGIYIKNNTSPLFTTFHEKPRTKLTFRTQGDQVTCLCAWETKNMYIYLMMKQRVMDDHSPRITTLILESSWDALILCSLLSQLLNVFFNYLSVMLLCLTISKGIQS